MYDPCLTLSGELHASAISLLEMELCSSITDYLMVENVGKEVSSKL
jgi:hypothetical protein